MLSYGWMEIGVLFLQHMLEVSAVRLHACTKMLAPLVNCIVNDALVDVTPHLLQTLFQFVSVVHPRLVHSLLDDAPDPAINRIKVRAVRWPKIRWNERRRCSRSRSVACRCAGALSCWKTKNSPDTSRITGRVVAALTGAHRGSKRR